MALNDAIRLLKSIKYNQSLRELLYLCDGPENIENIVKSLGFNFSNAELEDSYRTMLVKCQFRDEAEDLTEVYNIYRMLLGLVPVYIP